MSVCIKDLIKNLNLVVGCPVGCDYCYARNNCRRFHITDDFSVPEYYGQKLRLLDREKPGNWLLTGIDLVPILGEENMVQELPELMNQVLEEEKAWNRRRSK